MFNPFENPGNSLITVGILHVITGFIVKPIARPFCALIKRGWVLQLSGLNNFLFSPDFKIPDFEEAHSFWFHYGGLQFILFGEAIRQFLKFTPPTTKIPKVLSYSLIGLGVMGTLAAPTGGFPMLIGIGYWMLHYKRSA
ncbi:hypothetical protein HDV02_004811, partial [Globomyces sp. JEL0801]